MSITQEWRTGESYLQTCTSAHFVTKIRSLMKNLADVWTTLKR